MFYCFVMSVTLCTMAIDDIKSALFQNISLVRLDSLCVGSLEFKSWAAKSE